MLIMATELRSSKFTERKSPHVDNLEGQLNELGRWSSICRGATMWGLENAHSESLSALGANPKTVVSRLARFNYGICLAIPFDPSVHQSKDRVTHPNGGQYADNQMDWIILKVWLVLSQFLRLHALMQELG